jgi:hypothetical protein
MEEIERRGRFSKSRKFPLTNANKENGICFQRSLQKISTEMRKQLLLWPSSCLGVRWLRQQENSARVKTFF